MESSCNRINGSLLQAATFVDHDGLVDTRDSLGGISECLAHTFVLHFLNIIVRETTLEVICSWGVSKNYLSCLFHLHRSGYSRDLSPIFEGLVFVVELVFDAVEVHQSGIGGTFT